MNKIVEETLNIFDKFASSNREEWITEMQNDVEFRLGNQWTEQQVKDMEKRGQAPVVINRIHPAIEMTKSLLTSRNPSFRVSPREDSDNQIAQALNGLLQYVWQISNGDMVHADIVDDLCTKGIGYWYIHHSPQDDMGKGEVKLARLDPRDVYVDPNSRDRFFKDASDIIISRLYTKGLLKRLYPEFNKAISNATGTVRSDVISSNTSDSNSVFFPGTEEITRDGDFGEYIRYYERYTKEFVKRIKIFEEPTGREDMLEDKEFEEYIQQKAWIINGSVYTSEDKAHKIAQAVLQEYEAALNNADQVKQLYEQGQIEEQEYIHIMNSLPEPPSIQEVTNADLINMGVIKHVEITTQLVKMICVAGDTLLFERVLKTDEYPVIPLCNIHTGTPYPLSDVRIVKDKQKALNKIRSLILAHASSSTNVKLLLPRGSADVKEVEQNWARPGAIIEYEPSEGQPIPVPPLPMSNELFNSEAVLKADIDHEFGIYESMMGNAQSAPPTYKATIAVDEFGQRKMKNKMQIMESALSILGKVVLSYCQELYGMEKIVRIIQPNNSMTEYAINQRLYDEYGNVIDVVNDLSRAKYDVIIVSGSTLPSNRYAQLDFYMEAYQAGIIDKREVLKKTEVFDYEGVMQRTDEIAQLQAALEEAQNKIKELSGDLQTAQRQTVHANMAKINAQYEAKHKDKTLEAQKQNELFQARSADLLANAKEKVEIGLQKELLSQKNKTNK